MTLLERFLRSPSSGGASLASLGACPTPQKAPKAQRPMAKADKGKPSKGKSKAKKSSRSSRARLGKEDAGPAAASSSFFYVAAAVGLLAVIGAGAAVLLRLPGHGIDASQATQAYAVAPVKLASSECDELIEASQAEHILHEEKSQTSLGAQEERVSETWWLCSHTTDMPCEKSRYAGLASMLREAVESTNENHWKIAGLDKTGVDLKVLRYGATEGGHFHWHTDAGPNTDPEAAKKPRTRLLTVTLQLSDSQDYEGGDLQVGAVNVTRDQGTVLAYVSAMPHRVHTVTRGTRYALIMHFWYPKPFSARQLAKYRDEEAEPRVRALSEVGKGSASDVANWHLLYGEYLLGVGKAEPALEPYQRAIDAGETGLLAKAYHRRGLALGFLDRMPESAAHFTRSQELEPDDPVMLVNSVTALISTMQLSEAANNTERVMEIDPRPELLNNLADSWRRASDALKTMDGQQNMVFLADQMALRCDAKIREMSDAAQ